MFGSLIDSTAKMADAYKKKLNPVIGLSVCLSFSLSLSLSLALGTGYAATDDRSEAERMRDEPPSPPMPGWMLPSTFDPSLVRVWMDTS